MSEQTYIKAPVEWFVHQWDGNLYELQNWIDERESRCFRNIWHHPETHVVMVSYTLEGNFSISEIKLYAGDYLLYSPQLETFQYCRQDRFHTIYTAKL